MYIYLYALYKKNRNLLLFYEKMAFAKRKTTKEALDFFVTKQL